MAAYTRGEYTSPYAQKMEELYGQIEKRRNEEFEYDYQQDPVYKSMRKTALLNAQQSTADTLGRASALTGGRASTEAVRAAAQAGNNVKATLNNAVPSLYENAYNKWRNIYADMLSQYGVLQSNENTDYARWLEAENARSNEEATNYGRQQQETQYANTLKQQYYNNLVSLIGATGYTPTQTELDMAGMTADAAAALRNEYLRQVELQMMSGSGGGGGGGGRSSGGDDSDYLSNDEIYDILVNNTKSSTTGFNNSVRAINALESQGMIDSGTKTSMLNGVIEERAKSYAAATARTNAAVSNASSSKTSTTSSFNVNSILSGYRSAYANGRHTTSLNSWMKSKINSSSYTASQKQQLLKAAGLS